MENYCDNCGDECDQFSSMCSDCDDHSCEYECWEDQKCIGADCINPTFDHQAGECYTVQMMMRVVMAPS